MEVLRNPTEETKLQGAGSISGSGNGQWKRRTQRHNQKETWAEESWGAAQQPGERRREWILLLHRCSSAQACKLQLGTARSSRSSSLLDCTLDLGTWLTKLMTLKIQIWVLVCSGTKSKLQNSISALAQILTPLSSLYLWFSPFLAMKVKGNLYVFKPGFQTLAKSLFQHRP